MEFKDRRSGARTISGGNADNAGNDTVGGFIETFWDTLARSSLIVGPAARSRCAD